MLDIAIFILGIVWGIVTIFGWIFGSGDPFNDK